MILRATIAGTCLLSLACGPGPGTSESGAASTDETATNGTSSGATGSSSSTGETTPTTGGTGGTGETSGGTSTTGASTSEGTSTSSETTATSSGTTGAPACEDIVGSRDCAALVAVSGDLTLETCTKCQGTACGQEAECDDQFPCVDAQIVIQGCCSDAQCRGLTPFCGMFIGVDNVCVNDDDV